MNSKDGLVYVFEGGGKGKTSAALGIASRMLAIGKKVEWISWFKTLKWPISESHLPEYFGAGLKMHWVGEGFFIKSAKSKNLTGGAVARDYVSKTAHHKAAQNGLDLALTILNRKNPPDLLVLDELIKAINDGLLKTEDALCLIEKKGKTHLVMTGHKCPKRLAVVADLVTEMRKKKHPYDKGRLAEVGLDF